MLTSTVVFGVASLLYFLAFLVASSLIGEINLRQCVWVSLLLGATMTGSMEAIKFYGFESNKELAKEWQAAQKHKLMATEHFVTLEWSGAPIEDTLGVTHETTRRVELTKQDAAGLTQLTPNLRKVDHLSSFVD